MTLTDGRITVCIPTIPPRRYQLARALESVAIQQHPAHAVSVAVDIDREGAGPTRNRAIAGVTTEWIVSLDDDDELRDFCIAKLMQVQEATGADVVIPHYEVFGGRDPFPPDFAGKQFDVANPRVFPITVLARAALLQQCPFPAPTNNWMTADFPVWEAMWKLGAKFHAIPDRLWVWNHHQYPGNLSGMPTW